MKHILQELLCHLMETRWNVDFIYNGGYYFAISDYFDLSLTERYILKEHGVLEFKLTIENDISSQET